MNETAVALTQEQRSRVRFSRLVGLQAQADLLALRIRQETAALVEQDTPFAHRSFVPDELSMAIAESTGTCGRRVDDARITVAHPRLMALVAASAEAALASGEAIVTHDFGVLFRGRLRRWIQTRDVSFTFPGCQRLAQRCEIDHVLAYPLGATSHGNGACECVHHHQAKHASIPATRRADGCMVWTNRFGITVVRPPRALLRGW